MIEELTTTAVVDVFAFCLPPPHQSSCVLVILVLVFEEVRKDKIFFARQPRAGEPKEHTVLTVGTCMVPGTVAYHLWSSPHCTRACA